MPETHRLHSLHCYFLKAVGNSSPLLYHVSRLTNGKGYCTRSVVAKQAGTAVFSLQASFQRPEAAVLSAHTLPDINAPLHAASEPSFGSTDTLMRPEELLRSSSSSSEPPFRSTLLRQVLFPSAPCPAKQSTFYTWIKCVQIADPAHAMKKVRAPFCSANRCQLTWYQQCILAYLSDYDLLPTAPLSVRLQSMIVERFSQDVI